MSTASFDNANPKIATIVHRARGTYPKLFVVKCHRADLLFHRSKYGDFLVIPKPCR